MLCGTKYSFIRLPEKVSLSNYVLCCKHVENSVNEEIHIDSTNNYPKRAQNIYQLQPIYNYTKAIFDEREIDITRIKKSPIIPNLPPWEHVEAIKS